MITTSNRTNHPLWHSKIHPPMALTSLSLSSRLLPKTPFPRSPPSNAAMAQSFSSQLTTSSPPSSKIIDSHLHVWASPQEAAEKYPYFPGQEPAIPGDVDLLLKCMKDAGVDGALIVQPINHMFDHSFVTSVLKRYPSKFVGCCLANPAAEGSGINQLEHLVLKDGYRAVRFNPYLWPPGQKMTNAIGKAMFSKAGELGVPVGIMCMKGLSLHIAEIEELCSTFPSTTVLLDHVGFCKPPITEDESMAFSRLLELSRFPQVIVKLSALFRISRNQFPYEDTYKLLSQVVSVFGAKRLMWGSDFPFVVSECGYQEAKEPIYHMNLSSTDFEWIMGRTAMQLFQHSWTEV